MGNIKIMRYLYIALFLMFFGISSPSIAHKTFIFAWVEGDTVHSESKFAGGRKAKNATVEVYDNKGRRLLEGKTDDMGEFSFKIPERVELKLVVLAGTGHRGEWVVPLSELEGEGGNVSGAPQVKVQKEERTHLPQETQSLSSQDIQLAIEKALDKKLRPILKRLSETRQQRTTISDVICGIGYILGLVGIAAYFNYRRKKTGSDNS